jgi:hypothetical protein
MVMPHNFKKRPSQAKALHFFWAYAQASSEIQKDEVEAPLGDCGD